MFLLIPPFTGYSYLVPFVHVHNQLYLPFMYPVLFFEQVYYNMLRYSSNLRPS